MYLAMGRTNKNNVVSKKSGEGKRVAGSTQKYKVQLNKNNLNRRIYVLPKNQKKAKSLKNHNGKVNDN